jgi:hypothetical protein
MAKKDNSAIAWAVGLGTLVLAGVGIVLYEKSQAAPAGPGGGTGVQANLSACQKANTLAALAATSANPAAERVPYNTYAAQCRAAGGTPNPFPV